MMCPICGGLIPQPGMVYGWGGGFCSGHKDQCDLPKPHISCEHCWCKQVNKDGLQKEPRDHLQCCNCGMKKNIV